MSNHRSDYIDYRLSKANEASQDAKLLAENGRWNACINRLYYCCYYSVSALLLKQGITTKTHTGLKTQFNLHFIKTGIFSKEIAKLYIDLLDWRGKGDYDDMYDFTKEIVNPLLLQTEQFLSEIEKIIKQ